MNLLLLFSSYQKQPKKSLKLTNLHQICHDNIIQALTIIVQQIKTILAKPLKVRERWVNVMLCQSIYQNAQKMINININLNYIKSHMLKIYTCIMQFYQITSYHIILYLKLIIIDLYSFFNRYPIIKVSKFAGYLQLFYSSSRIDIDMTKNQYEVQGIIGKRRKKNTNRYEYHVVWKGYTKDQATWEPEANLSNVADLVEQFNKKIQKNKMMASNAKTNGNMNGSTSETNKMQVENRNSLSKEKVQPKQQPPPKKAEKKPIVKKSMIQDDDDCFEETKSAVYEQPPATLKKAVTTKSKPKNEPVIKKQAPKIPQTAQTRNISQKQMNQLNTSGQSNGQSIGPQFQSDNQQLNLQIVGMFLNEYGKISYAVLDHQNNRKVLKDRKELILEQPKALIRFYEKNMNLSVL